MSTSTESHSLGNPGCPAVHGGTCPLPGHDPVEEAEETCPYCGETATAETAWKHRRCSEIDA